MVFFNSCSFVRDTRWDKNGFAVVVFLDLVFERERSGGEGMDGIV